MAIKLVAHYSKRLGLPGYSSHQFSVSIETELVTTDDVAAESQRICVLLQTSVDEQIQHTGFIPPTDYGMDGSSPPTSAPSSANSRQSTPGPARWKCSDKQRDLIENLVAEHNLDKTQVESLAVDRFVKGVRLLNKVEASGLIDALIDTYGGHNRQQGGQRRSAYAGGRAASRRASVRGR